MYVCMHIHIYIYIYIYIYSLDQGSTKGWLVIKGRLRGGLAELPLIPLITQIGGLR